MSTTGTEDTPATFISGHSQETENIVINPTNSELEFLERYGSPVRREGILNIPNDIHIYASNSAVQR